MSKFLLFFLSTDGIMKLPWLLFVLGMLIASSKVYASVKDDLSPVDGEIQGSSKCARVNGCKVTNTQYCTGPSSGNQCFGCFYKGVPTDEHNIFRADFYKSMKNQELINNLKTCTGDNCPVLYANEMVKYMLLKDDRIARNAQAPFLRHFNIPSNALHPDVTFEEAYSTKFCDENCTLAMRDVCLTATITTHVKKWCLNVLEWVQDQIPDLEGPASFIAYMAAKATYGGVRYPVIPKKGGPWPGLWPPGQRFYWASTDERAALVAAAATSILLAGNWWNEVDPTIIEDFGFAVQHSLFIAIYAGRLRISIQQAQEHAKFRPGTKAFCPSEMSLNEAPNFTGITGNVFAAICAAFGHGNGQSNLRYRPEISERNDEGCVERTTGMAFIMPGDWISQGFRYSEIGSASVPDGLSFSGASENTLIELYSSGIARVFAPAVAANIDGKDRTECTGEKGKGNGSNLSGDLLAAGIQGVGGMCNWVASW